MSKVLRFVSRRRASAQHPDLSFYNLNIVNSYGKPVAQSQAIALSVEQDTLLAQTGAQFYGKSRIEGAVDFIFGQYASIWITGSTIKSIGNGCITASGRSTADSNYYVINDSTIEGTGTVYLGRPWADYARVIVQNSNIGSQVAAAGWQGSATPKTDHILFGEYNNKGAGAWHSGRAFFSTKLSAGVSISGKHELD
ncbi:pectinesterase [Ceratobasidium sp. AG-Ba]|nr:pectinesterase [Ceratobasidium sp. AG-Ba]